MLGAQFGFLGHEASHRELFAFGSTDDRAEQIVGRLVVGASLAQSGGLCEGRGGARLLSHEFLENGV